MMLTTTTPVLQNLRGVAPPSGICMGVMPHNCPQILKMMRIPVRTMLHHHIPDTGEWRPQICIHMGVMPHRCAQILRMMKTPVRAMLQYHIPDTGELRPQICIHMGVMPHNCARSPSSMEALRKAQCVVVRVSAQTGPTCQQGMSQT